MKYLDLFPEGRQAIKLPQQKNKFLIVVNGMTGQDFVQTANSDGHLRETFRVFITEKLEGKWELALEDRKTIQASVSLKAITGHSKYPTSDFFVGLPLNPPLEWETTQNRYYMDVNVGASQTFSGDSVRLEFSCNVAFIATKLV